MVTIFGAELTTGFTTGFATGLIAALGVASIAQARFGTAIVSISSNKRVGLLLTMSFRHFRIESWQVDRLDFPHLD